MKMELRRTTTEISSSLRSIEGTMVWLWYCIVASAWMVESKEMVRLTAWVGNG